MNEKEKMLKGELYNPTVEKLTGDRTNCKFFGSNEKYYKNSSIALS